MSRRNDEVRVQLLNGQKRGENLFHATASGLGWKPREWPEKLIVTVPVSGSIVNLKLIHNLSGPDSPAPRLYQTRDGSFRLIVAID
jgi:hypothetical protein